MRKNENRWGGIKEGDKNVRGKKGKSQKKEERSGLT